MDDRSKDFSPTYGAHLAQPQSSTGSGVSAAAAAAAAATSPWSYGSAGAGAAAGYGLAAAPSSVNMAAAAAAAFPQHYMQQLQTFSNFAGNPISASNPYPNHPSSMFGGAAPLSSGGGGDKGLFGYPSGHPMHFHALPSSYHRPLPAHSPLPAHLRGNEGSPGSSPLPAHMRSNPYQPSANYHTLNVATTFPPVGSLHPNYLPPVASAAPSGYATNSFGSTAEYKAPGPNISSDPKTLSNGHHSQHSRGFNHGHQQQPQHYGNPKDFSSLSRPDEAHKSYKANLALATSQTMGYITGSAPNSHASLGQQAAALTSSSSSYDAMAAQILNSFGGASFQANLIQPDINRHTPNSVSSILASQLSTSAADSSQAVLQQQQPVVSVHQPRGPTIDTRGPGNHINGLQVKTNEQSFANLQPLPPSSSGVQADTFSILPQCLKTQNYSPRFPAATSDAPSNNIQERSQKDGDRQGWKRKNSSENGEVLKSAKLHKDNVECVTPVGNDCLDDPYSFDQEERDSASSSVEFVRFGTGAVGRKQQAVSGGPVYKFKSALLSRESRTSSTESRSSVTQKSIPMYFDESSEVFLEMCDNFLADLQSKPISISRRPSMDAYRERLAAKKEKNANRGRKKRIAEEETLPEPTGQLNSTSVSETTHESDSAGSTPKKKSPGRKKKHLTPEVIKVDESDKVEPSLKEQKQARDNNNQTNEVKDGSQKVDDPKPLKKGVLWALPIVPKLPQKAEKRRSSPVPPPATKSKDVDLCDVWRQAFGGVKNKRPSETCPMTENQKLKQEPDEPKRKTFIDIPPEVRRRPKPSFGGIIHFPPDWEHRVKQHHEKCRLPVRLVRGIQVKPKILSSESSVSPPRDKIDAPQISPQNKCLISPDIDDLSPPRLSSEVTLVNNLARSDLELSESTACPSAINVVDAILAKRKARHAFGRMYKVPSHMKKRQQKKSYDRLPEDGIGLLPTPGLPLLTEDTTEVLMGTNFGNFRRQTLLRYLDAMDDAAELKAKILDWKPEVFETKTRRQSNQVKTVTSYREIFGIDLPSHQEEEEEVQLTSPKKKKKDAKESSARPEAAQEKEKTSKKSIKKKDSSNSAVLEEALSSRVPSSNASASIAEEGEDPEPTEDEESLQNYLQTFALDLLDDNISWSNKTVIQNLVIWEPIGPVVPEKKIRKKYKKHKKRQSGLDFSCSNKRKGKSRDVSRAESPVDREAKELHSVIYNLDNVIAESRNWVIDKGAGETILHRASKMGYPDVVAYALDIINMPASIKDNAGITPIHKAAFRGHADIVKCLLKYGVDPNTNVKGTRPLHEALEGGNSMAVYHLLSYGADPLLYDYSGNMPIDLTEEDEEMKEYLTALLADLHGKNGKRWRVGHSSSFSLPPESPKEKQGEQVESQGTEEAEDFLFEVSSQPLPPYFMFPDRQGHFVFLSDLKGKVDAKKSELIHMSWEEFVKSAHCSLLGYSKPHRPPNEKVDLVLVDSSVKKILGIELPPPVKVSPTVKNARRS